jgi:hypothetical protein
MRIDMVTLGLLLIAVLPWLASIVKTLELPGGVKIELQDVKAATEPVVAQTATAVGAESASTRPNTATAWNVLRSVAIQDPNLALVGTRIEIEKRLVRLADLNGIDTSKGSASRLLRDLLTHNAIQPPSVADGLKELIILGNQAAHGADVSLDAGNWVLNRAPFILALLDAWIDDAERGGDAPVPQRPNSR